MTNQQNSFTHSPELEEQFRKLFNANATLQTRLTETINKFRRHQSSSQPPATIEQIQQDAISAFVGINEIIAGQVFTPAAWQQAESVFQHTMRRGPTSGLRESVESYTVSDFQRYAQFGYSLIISNEFKAEDEFVELWDAVKNYYRQFYKV